MAYQASQPLQYPHSIQGICAQAYISVQRSQVLAAQHVRSYDFGAIALSSAVCDIAPKQNAATIL